MLIKSTRRFHPNEVNNIIKDITKQYSIKLILLSEDETKRNNYEINHAYSTNNEIIIAYFTLSPEHILIAFFHELSHIINLNNFKQYNKFMQELNVSLFGINLAKDKYNITFNDDIIKWLIKQSFTYCH